MPNSYLGIRNGMGVNIEDYDDKKLDKLLDDFN